MQIELVFGGAAAVVACGVLLFMYAGKSLRDRDLSPVSNQWLIEQRVGKES